MAAEHAANRAAEPEPSGAPARRGLRGRVVRQRWHPVNLLLLVPIVLSLATPLFNRQDPKLFGFPAFYWLQLAFVFAGVASTTIVYQVTRDRRNRRDGD